MALPESWATVTVSGSYLERDGAPAQGRVVFRPPPRPLIHSGVVVTPIDLVAPLDEDGAFSIVVPSTDDPGLMDTTWQYLVIEQIVGWRIQPFTTSLAYTAGAVDISTLR